MKHLVKEKLSTEVEELRKEDRNLESSNLMALLIARKILLDNTHSRTKA